MSIAWPTGTSDADQRLFCEGLKRDLDQYEIDLIGGDTVSTPGPMVLSMTLTGTLIGNGPIRRFGACPDEDIWVSGVVGDGYLGLLANRGEVLPGDASECEFAREHYLVPNVPALPMASLISEFASSSLDVSDGLVADARQIALASGVPIQLNAETVPLSACGTSYVAQHGPDGMKRLLSGGDDYQCLFTAPKGAADAVSKFAREAGLSCHRIGSTLKSGEPEINVKWNDEVLEMVNSGWEHD